MTFKSPLSSDRGGAGHLSQVKEVKPSNIIQPNLLLCGETSALEVVYRVGVLEETTPPPVKVSLSKKLNPEILPLGRLASCIAILSPFVCQCVIRGHLQSCTFAPLHLKENKYFFIPLSASHGLL